MKTLGKRVSNFDIPFLPLFVASALFVMWIMFFQKSELLLQTEVFSKNALSLMKYQTSNDRSLFLYVLKERIWVIPFLFLMSTTYLSALATYSTIIWYGTGVGALLGLAMLRYGLRGILLLLVAALPHYLLYVPAIIVALQLSKVQRAPSRKFFGQLFVLEMVVIIGCFIESYVNLFLAEKIINFFII